MLTLPFSDATTLQLMLQGACSEATKLGAVEVRPPMVATLSLQEGDDPDLELLTLGLNGGMNVSYYVPAGMYEKGIILLPDTPPTQDEIAAASRVLAFAGRFARPMLKGA